MTRHEYLIASGWKVNTNYTYTRYGRYKKPISGSYKLSGADAWEKQMSFEGKPYNWRPDK